MRPEFGPPYHDRRHLQVCKAIYYTLLKVPFGKQDITDGRYRIPNWQKDLSLTLISPHPTRVFINLFITTETSTETTRTCLNYKSPNCSLRDLAGLSGHQFKLDLI